MWTKFKWDMFITSFIPLWLSIIISDVWDIIIDLRGFLSKEGNAKQQLIDCAANNTVQLVSVTIIVILVVSSFCGINSFLKEREGIEQNIPCSILKARKANKLSSEFLLAYILPLIAFDFGELKSVVMFLIYFMILSNLCIRNNNIYTNIMLEFKRYRLYTCDIQRFFPGGQAIMYYDSLVISRDDLSALEGNEINCWDCDNYTYIHIRGEQR